MFVFVPDGMGIQTTRMVGLMGILPLWAGFDDTKTRIRPCIVCLVEYSKIKNDKE